MVSSLKETALDSPKEMAVFIESDK